MNHAKRAKIKKRLNLVNLCETGYWFCSACQHVTELNLEGVYNKCGICDSHRINWHSPISSPNIIP